MQCFLRINKVLATALFALLPLAAPGQSNEDCLTCHSDPALARETDGKHLFTDTAVLSRSVHAANNCTDCHAGLNMDETPHMPADARSLKLKGIKACLACHLDNPEVMKRVGPSAGFIQSYEGSVHGKALAAGNGMAAGCADCHGSHDIRKGADSRSGVMRGNMARTCAKCHAEIDVQYEQSIHGTALRKGNPDAPTCTGCHGEHQILAPSDPKSRVAARNVSAEVCAACHNSVRISAKYGIPSERFKTFSDSYHGLAIKGGDVEVANCASCHGVHNIKPSSDPSSTVSRANLAATCGRCHPGTNGNWARGSVHVTMARDANPILYWIRIFYLFLIAGTVGGMFLHNLLDFIRKYRNQRAGRPGAVHRITRSTREHLRMTLNERLQHGLLLSSFILLVITGFMLKFPDAWWVAPIRRISESIFTIRGILHRGAAAVLIFATLYHLAYLLFSARGRRLARDMMPAWKDVRDSAAMVLYNIGLSGKKPLFDRFSYIEKAEYWALVWGGIVMTITGIIMWFDNTFIGLFTKLGWDVARTIHYYEAWLATLAILVWHFYFVIFNLDVYPMNTAWVTGRIPETLMEEEHPLEMERIRSDDFSLSKSKSKKSGI